MHLMNLTESEKTDLQNENCSQIAMSNCDAIGLVLPVDVHEMMMKPCDVFLLHAKEWVMMNMIVVKNDRCQKLNLRSVLMGASAEPCSSLQ